MNIVGDSVLAEFKSAVAAVAAAIDIQERMARFNDMLDEDQRLMFDELMMRREGIVIGRDFDQCGLALSHSTVSRQHARLIFTGGVLQVEYAPRGEIGRAHV